MPGRVWRGQRCAELGVESPDEVTVGLGSIEVFGNCKDDFSGAEDFSGAVESCLEWIRGRADGKLRQRSVHSSFQ